MGRVLLSFAWGALCVVALSARAEPRADSKQGAARSQVDAPPLSADVLVVARWADRVGDEAALSFLAPKRSARLAWVAMLAVPHLHAPEMSLLSLAVLAGGRDPDLAPSAARTSLNVASTLSYDGLSRREVLPSELAPALKAFCELQERLDVRLDIALMAGQVAVQLVELGVGVCPGSGSATAGQP